MSYKSIYDTWDDAICESPGLRTLRVSGIKFPDGLPHSLSTLPSGAKVEFDNCEIGSFPAQALAGEGKISLRFDYIDGPFEELKQHAIVHGTGRCEFIVFYQDTFSKDKDWSLIWSLGSDALGDTDLRTWAYRLRSYGAGGLKPPATQAHLSLMTWSRKPVRVAALGFLEAHWPNPIEQAPAQAAFFVMGKPSYHTAKELKERIKARGWKVVTRPDKADFALLLDQPKDKLQRALDAGLPVVLEQHVKAHLDAAEGPGAALSEAQEDKLADLLQSTDPETVKWALGLLKSVELSGEVLTSLVLAMMFNPEAKLRKAAKVHLLGHAPDKIVQRFIKDRRNYGSLTNGRKLLKLAKEMEGLGLDGAQFALGMLHGICIQRNTTYLTDEVLLATLAWPENTQQAFATLSSLDTVYLPKMTASFWPHMSELRQTRRLRVAQGRHKNGDNMDQLAAMPKLEVLEYWVTPARLDLLAPLAHKLKSIEFRGSASKLDSIAELATWDKLEVLRISNTEVTDLSPLAGLPIRNLQIGQTKITDLSVLTELTELSYLNMEKLTPASLEPLRGLSKLTGLNLAHVQVDDWSILQDKPALESLDLWGHTLDLAELPIMPKLKTLNLPWCKVTNVAALNRQPALRWINATCVTADEAEVQAYREAHPDNRFST